MTPHQTPQTPPQDQQAEDAQYYRRVLHKIIDLASNIAQSLHDDATQKRPAYAPPPTPEETQTLSLAFDRIARCIRRTILLARNVAEPPKAPAKSREATRKQILREVEDAIDREAPPKAAPALRAELMERLDAPEFAEDLEHDLATRPIEDIIAELCRDLGVPVNNQALKWKRRTPGDIVALNAQAAAPPRPPPEAPPRPHGQKPP